MAVQLLKSMAPALAPLIERPAGTRTQAPPAGGNARAGRRDRATVLTAVRPFMRRRAAQCERPS